MLLASGVTTGQDHLAGQSRVKTPPPATAAPQRGAGGDVVQPPLAAVRANVLSGRLIRECGRKSNHCDGSCNRTTFGQAPERTTCLPRWNELIVAANELHVMGEHIAEARTQRTDTIIRSQNLSLIHI